MAIPRLPTTWPSLWRSAACDISNPAVRSARAAQRIHAYHSTSRWRQQEAQTQRYGTANEPPGYLGGGKSTGPPTKKKEGDEAVRAAPKTGEKLGKDVGNESQDKKDEVKPENREATTVDGRTIPMPAPAEPPASGSNQAATIRSPDPSDQPPPEQRPLASYLEAASKSTEDAKEQHKAQEQLIGARKHLEEPTASDKPPKAPHIDTPMYKHTFDTYGLVKRLSEGTWSENESVSIMKAVRLMLAENTELAQKALVSKSNLENEAYLFKAACAELKTETMARRRAEQERMRTERNQLQHEVDILSQRLGQEVGCMKDELKGMFDDRKMAVRNEQRTMESKVQQLNYAITVSLQADAKSEVEGLRWIMTRRVILTLGIIVAMVIGGLKLWSDSLRDAAEAEGKKTKNKGGKGSPAKEERRAESSFADSEFRKEAQALAGGVGEVVVREGDNPAFVSLG